MKDETVWLTKEQMVKLFDRDYKNIRKHINNDLQDNKFIICSIQKFNL